MAAEILEAKVRKAQEIYDRVFSEEMREKYDGQCVAIDTKTEEWAVAERGIEAIEKLKASGSKVGNIALVDIGEPTFVG